MADVSIRHRLEWLAVRAIFGIFRLLGQERASRFGGWLARKIGPRLSVQKLARENMRKALPELTDAEIEAHLMKMWDNLGRNVGELPYFKSMMSDPEKVELAGHEYLDQYLASGRAAFFVTAHYGPWELVALVGRYAKPKATGIYRAANNPLVEEFFQDLRADPDYKFHPKGKEGARAILRAARDNGAVVLLNDQKLNAGLAVPFFGRDAMTAPAVAEIACKMDIPVYPMRTERLENGKLRLTIYPALDIPRSGERQEDVYRILKAINETYEDWIRERPDHWFWVHNRWP